MGVYGEEGEPVPSEEEREFYLALRRALLQVVRTIEKRYMTDRGSESGAER